MSFFTVVNKSNVNNEMCQLLIFVCGPVVFASPGYNRPGRVNVKHQVTHGFGKGSFLVHGTHAGILLKETMHSWILGVVETVQLIVGQFFSWSFRRLWKRPHLP